MMLQGCARMVGDTIGAIAKSVGNIIVLVQKGLIKFCQSSCHVIHVEHVKLVILHMQF